MPTVGPKKNEVLIMTIWEKWVTDLKINLNWEFVSCCEGGAE